jgi:hypothetical protein
MNATLKKIDHASENQIFFNPVQNQPKWLAFVKCSINVSIGWFIEKWTALHLIGPKKNKYRKTRPVRERPPHNINLRRSLVFPGRENPRTLGLS